MKPVAWRFWVTDHPSLKPFWTGWLTKKEEAEVMMLYHPEYECAYAEPYVPMTDDERKEFLKSLGYYCISSYSHIVRMTERAVIERLGMRMLNATKDKP